MPPARRQPTQARAIATRERIVDAAIEQLGAAGYDRASTNKIAAAAGVSPGTLYQYFASKDDVLHAVIGRVLNAFGAALVPALAEVATAELEPGIQITLGTIVEELGRHAPVIRAVAEHVPAAAYAAQLTALQAQVEQVTHLFLASRLPGCDRGQLRELAWIAARTSEHLALRYVLEAPPITPQAFVAHTSKMLLALTAGK